MSLEKVVKKDVFVISSYDEEEIEKVKRLIMARLCCYKHLIVEIKYRVEEEGDA